MTVKNSNFDSFRDTGLPILVKLSLRKLHKVTKIKIQSFEFVKIAVFETLKSVKIDLSENLQKFSHRADLTSHFETFLGIVQSRVETERHKH